MKLFIFTTGFVSLILSLAFTSSAHAANIQLTESQKQQIKSVSRTQNLTNLQTTKSSDFHSLATSTYYYLVDPLTSSNGQTVLSNSVPFSYDIFSTNSNAQFRDFVFCPYNFSDSGAIEVLIDNCVRSTMPGFNNGTYYSGVLTGNGARLLYPGANNLSCVVYSTFEDTYQDCTEFNTSRVQRVNYTGTDFPVYRFWSNQKQHHFYTIDSNEKTNIQNTYDPNTWNYERIAWTTKRFNGSYCEVGAPVFRFWSDQKQGHFYTISNSEKDYIQTHYPSNVWRYEGVAYCAPEYTGVCPDTYAPVFRFWSDQKQGHFYTISSVEKDQIQATYPSYVWRYEGIAMCAQM